MARPAPTARSSALRILNSVLGEGRLMSEVLGTGLLDPLSAPDRARAQRLANDTLRGMERADRLLNRHLRKQPPCRCAMSCAWQLSKYAWVGMPMVL